MTPPRLTARFWVDAYLTRLRLADIPAFVTARGDATAGAVGGTSVFDASTSASNLTINNPSNWTLKISGANASGRSIWLGGKALGHVLITGGSRGLGAGIVQAYLDADYRVATCARTRTEQIDQWLADDATADRLLFCETDVSNRKDDAAFIRAVVEKWERIDVLVNNAGVARDGGGTVLPRGARARPRPRPSPPVPRERGRGRGRRGG